MNIFSDPSLATMDVIDTITSEVTTNTATSQIENTANILNNYGPTVTILAIFILICLALFLIFAKYFRKMMDRILDGNINLNTEDLIRQTVNNCVSEVMEMNKNTVMESIEASVKKEKESHKNIVSVYIDSEKVFKEASSAAMRELKCHRIAIYLFHNGNSTPYGYPFAKMSCVHEITDKGSYLTPRGHSHINVPLYVFSELIEDLSDDGECIVENVKELAANGDIQIGTFIQGDNVESIFAASIKNSDNCLVSFAIAEFQEKQDFSNEEYLNTIRSALHDMNNSIYHIVVSDEFVDNFEE